MNYPKSKEILEEIKKAQKILVNCHRSPDADSVGSALATYLVLTKMGKDIKVGVRVINAAGKKDDFIFLQGGWISFQ